MLYQDIYNCICQNTKKWRYTIQYVKPTAQLVFKNRFPKGGPTCRRQVVDPRHQTSQGQSVAMEMVWQIASLWIKTGITVFHGNCSFVTFAKFCMIGLDLFFRSTALSTCCWWIICFICQLQMIEICINSPNDSYIGIKNSISMG